MTTHDRISIDPAICHGRPVIRGTRVPVAVITGSLAGGMSIEQVAREYDVTAEDIQAARAYVTDAVGQVAARADPQDCGGRPQ